MGKALVLGYGAVSGQTGSVLLWIVLGFGAVFVIGMVLSMAAEPKSRGVIEDEQKHADNRAQERSCRNTARDEARWKERR